MRFKALILALVGGLWGSPIFAACPAGQKTFYTKGIVSCGSPAVPSPSPAPSLPPTIPGASKEPRQYFSSSSSSSAAALSSSGISYLVPDNVSTFTPPGVSSHLSSRRPALVVCSNNHYSDSSCLSTSVKTESHKKVFENVKPFHVCFATPLGIHCED